MNREQRRAAKSLGKTPPHINKPAGSSLPIAG
jgi:hypothetical protein